MFILLYNQLHIVIFGFWLLRISYLYVFGSRCPFIGGCHVSFKAQSGQIAIRFDIFLFPLLLLLLLMHLQYIEKKQLYNSKMGTGNISCALWKILFSVHMQKQELDFENQKSTLRLLIWETNVPSLLSRWQSFPQHVLLHRLWHVWQEFSRKTEETTDFSWDTESHCSIWWSSVGNEGPLV